MYQKRVFVYKMDHSVKYITFDYTLHYVPFTTFKEIRKEPRFFTIIEFFHTVTFQFTLLN